MKRHAEKNGQAMIEFLVGLVGILVLVLALSQITTIVDSDMTSMLNARMDVAEDLINSSISRPPPVYDPAASYDVLDQNINVNANGAYAEFQQNYSQSARADGFEYLRNGTDPLDAMMGSQKGHTVEVESELMRSVFGRSSISLRHEVWMPPWDDLL